MTDTQRPLTLEDFYQAGFDVRHGPYNMGATKEFSLLWVRLSPARTQGVSMFEADDAFLRGYTDAYPPTPDNDAARDAAQAEKFAST